MTNKFKLELTACCNPHWKKYELQKSKDEYFCTRCHNQVKKNGETLHGLTVNELQGKKFIYKENIPFNIIGKGETDAYPLKVQTWEGRGQGKLMGKITCNYTIESIVEMIKERKLILK